MLTDWMMSKTTEVDYGALVADDFLKWSASWSWTWKRKVEAGEPVKPSPRTQTPKKIASLQGDRYLSLSPQKAFLSSISQSAATTSQDSSTPTSPPSSSSPSTTSSSPCRSPVPAVDPVFINKYFEVRTSPKGGYGAFAIKDIAKDAEIIMEKALFTGTIMEVFYLFEQLAREQRQEYMKLYGHHRFGAPKILSIFKTNRFEVNCSEGGIFLKCSRFNHACHPWANCTYQVLERKYLKVTALFDIAKGQELTISYTNIPEDLPAFYGFYCDCPGCPAPKAAAERAMMLKGPNEMAHDCFY